MVWYRVRDWDRLYENAESRKLTQLRWVKISNKHDGKGFRRIAAKENATELYAAFILILQVASKMPVRGVLIDEDGPLDAEDVAMKTGFPERIFVDAFEWFSSEKIKWLEKFDGEPPKCNPDEAPTRKAPPEVSPKKKECVGRKSRSTGKSRGKGKKMFGPDSEELRIACMIWESISEWNKSMKAPNLQTWAKDIDLMHRIDKRSYEDIRNVFKGVCADDFWCKNILSPSKLRQKWNEGKLVRCYEQSGMSGKHTGSSGAGGGKGSGRQEYDEEIRL